MTEYQRGFAHGLERGVVQAIEWVRIQRLVEDGQTAGWVVDTYGSRDTSSRMFSRHQEDEARELAQHLSDLFSIPVRQVEDDVL